MPLGPNSRIMVPYCVNCAMTLENHGPKKKCLFEPTFFKPPTYGRLNALADRYLGFEAAYRFADYQWFLTTRITIVRITMYVVGPALAYIDATGKEKSFLFNPEHLRTSYAVKRENPEPD